MKKTARTITAGALGAGLASAFAIAALADEDAELVINGEIPMTVRAPAPEHMENMDTIMSGWVFRSDETQAMEEDDFTNPGMLFVDQAREMWNDASLGTNGESCSSCHETPEDLEGVKAVYPKWDEEHGEVQTIEMQVNECVTERMAGEALKYDGGEMMGMVSLIASVSRGMPVNVAIDGPAQSTWEQGKELYYTRFGQLELSCASCHEENWGNMIRADHLSQGQINGFPVYRLNNASLNSVHGRFRGCVRDTRAETYAVGSPEFVALELYVTSRGNGLSVEGPSVRN